MSRRSNRTSVQLAAFVFVLLLILLFTRKQASNRHFSWRTIRYKTTSPTLPEARGKCPGLSEGSRPALIVSRVQADGDTRWLSKLEDLYHMCVYTADATPKKDSVYLQVPANHGHETMAYLTFLIDNYDNIPAAGAVFVHGTRFAWHNDDPEYDNLALLLALNVSSATEADGYHNLRCDWSVGTCPANMRSQASMETSLQAATEPWNARAASDKALPRALLSLFGVEGHDSMTSALGRASIGRSDVVRSQCCAQFVVSRESVWQHSRQEYIALRQWLLDGNSMGGSGRPGAAAPQDDRVSGRIVSYLWHILFIRHHGTTMTGGAEGEESGLDLEQLNYRACPSAADCYCRLYGRCDLDGCKAGSCRGQYSVPPKFKLPDDWADTHGKSSL